MNTTAGQSFLKSQTVSNFNNLDHGYDPKNADNRNPNNYDTKKFPKVSDNDSGAKENVSFYIPPVAADWFWVGMSASSSYSSANPIKVFQPVNDDPERPCLIKPTGLGLVWACKGNGKKYCNLGIYTLKAPQGYTPVGVIAVSDFTKVDVNNPMATLNQSQYSNLRCVRDDLVEQITTSSKVWDDHSSGSKFSASVWTLTNSSIGYTVTDSGYTKTSVTYFDIKSEFCNNI